MAMRRIGRLLGVTAPLAIAACTGPSLYVPIAQSGFAPPNSNAFGGTHVRATVRTSYISPFNTPIIPDARLQREAYAKALAPTGADLITDGHYQVRTTLIPLLLVQVYNVEGTVEGTAVKVAEIGARPLQ